MPSTSVPRAGTTKTGRTAPSDVIQDKEARDADPVAGQNGNGNMERAEIEH